MALISKDRINEIETELDGLDFVIKDTLLNLQVIQKRMQELRATLLTDELDEF